MFLYSDRLLYIQNTNPFNFSNLIFDDISYISARFCNEDGYDVESSKREC